MRHHEGRTHPGPVPRGLEAVSRMDGPQAGGGECMTIDLSPVVTRNEAIVTPA